MAEHSWPTDLELFSDLMCLRKWECLLEHKLTVGWGGGPGGGGRVRGGGKGNDIEWEPIAEHLVSLKNVFLFTLLLLLFPLLPIYFCKLCFVELVLFFYSIFILISSPDYTDLAMSTVKQTQAIPYTGPFNLLYYQLQKLTGVYLLTFT